MHDLQQREDPDGHLDKVGEVCSVARLSLVWEADQRDAFAIRPDPSSRSARLVNARIFDSCQTGSARLSSARGNVSYEAPAKTRVRRSSRLRPFGRVIQGVGGEWALDESSILRSTEETPSLILQVRSEECVCILHTYSVQWSTDGSRTAPGSENLGVQATLVQEA
jgi:hypothetical protein